MRVWTWLLVGLLLLFNSGKEAYRLNSSQLQRQLKEDPGQLFKRPWDPIRMYVSRNSDERQYFVYTQLLRGGDVDRADLAERRAVPVEDLRISSGHHVRFPHRDFSVEYPPLFWAAIFPPAWLVDSLSGYRLSFGLWMACLMLVTVLLAWRIRNRGNSQVSLGKVSQRAFWLCLAIGPLLVIRFDILPALLTVLSVECLLARRLGLSGFTLGLATTAKVYPILLIPILIAAIAGEIGWKASLPRLIRFSSGLILAIAAVTLPFIIRARSGFWADLISHAQRPLEIESVLGTPLLLFKGSHSFHAFGCINLAAPGSVAMAWISCPLTLLLIGFSSWLTFRAAIDDRRRALVEGCLLALLAALVGAKVLSAQYILWPLPFVLAMEGRRGWWYSVALGMAALLAQIWYPLLWRAVVGLEPAAIALLVVRNSLLVALFIHSAVSLYKKQIAAPVDFAIIAPKDCQPLSESAGI